MTSVGAERGDALDLARRGRDEHARVGSERLHDLLRGSRDAAAAAVQQHGLAVLEPCVQEQVHVGGDIGFADAGRLRESQALGDPHDVTRVGDRELRVASAAEQREHALAGRKARDTRAERTR